MAEKEKQEGERAPGAGPIRRRLEEKMDARFLDKLMKEIDELDTKDKVKWKIDLLKLVMPRTSADDDRPGFDPRSALRARLFSPDDTLDDE